MAAPANPAAAQAAFASVDLKVVLLGKQYVGKTALMERFLHERYLSEDGYVATIGAAYGAKRVRTKSASSGGSSIVLGVWDTAGQESFESLARIYYRGAGAAVVCYDVTEPESLTRAQFWASEVTKYEPQCRLYVCGCKLDLALADPEARRVSTSAAKKFADNICAPVVETSSKTGVNVAELFATIAEDFVRTRAGPASSAGGSGGGDAAGTAASLSLHSQQQQPPQGKPCACSLA